MESKHVMASYMALIYDIDPARKLLGCELYCLFSNIDDSEISKPSDAPPSLKQLLRTDGQASTELEGTRSMEEHLLTELLKQVYDDRVEVVMRKVRP